VERLPDLATELVRLPIHVLIAAGSAAIRAAQQATSTIPIVMTTYTDAVAQGFVGSVARPGGNITGLAGPGVEIRGNWRSLKRPCPRSLASPSSGTRPIPPRPPSCLRPRPQRRLWG